MQLRTSIAGLVLVLPVLAAEPPLPELRVEPTAGGSIFFVKNVSNQPLTAYLIELVNYPGSSFSLWQDDAASQAIAPGSERRTAVANMTVGAVPDYVKIEAALYADGTSSGIPEKVTQMVARRRSVLETTRELIQRLAKARQGGEDKSAVAAELKQRAAGMEPAGKARRNSQADIDKAAGRILILETAMRLTTHSVEETLSTLKASEQALAASKPAL